MCDREGSRPRGRGQPLGKPDLRPAQPRIPGLTYVNSAVWRLSAEVGIVGMDVVEVSRPYDSGNSITALHAHRCTREALTGTAMRRLGLTARDYVDPRSAGNGAARTYREKPAQ